MKNKTPALKFRRVRLSGVPAAERKEWRSGDYKITWAAVAFGVSIDPVYRAFVHCGESLQFVEGSPTTHGSLGAAIAACCAHNTGGPEAARALWQAREQKRVERNLRAKQRRALKASTE